MNDFNRYDVVIMSEDESDNDDDEDTTYLLTNDNRVSKIRSPTSNVVTVPITGINKSRTINTNNNNNPKPPEKPKANGRSPQSTTTTTFNENDADDANTSHVTDSTSSDSTSFHDNPVTYRHSGYAFSDKENGEVLRGRKRSIVQQTVLVCVIVLLQSVGFVLYVPDVLFINIPDAHTQHLTYVLLLVTSAFSAMTSQLPIHSLGNKWMLFIGCIGSSLFSCARFFGTLPFMIPAAILAGLAQGPFMVTQYSYVTKLAADYASYENGRDDIVAGIFFGFLNSWVFLAPFFGVLLRYMFIASETSGTFRDEGMSCGKDFCWTSASGMALYESNEAGSRNVNADFRVQALLGSYLVCALGGAMLACLNIGSGKRRVQSPVLSVSDYALEEEDEEPCCGTRGHVEIQWSWLWEGLQNLCDGHAWLVLLLLVYVGGQQLLAYSVFVQTFSQCQTDLASSLLVVVTLSIGGALGCIPSGYISAVYGKVKVISTGYVIQVTLLIVMVTVELPRWSHFLIGFFWGLSDAMFQSIVTGISSWSTSVNSGAALCCLRFCQLIGYVFLASFQIGHVCNRAILITTLCVLTIAMMCYIAMEITVRLEVRAAREIHKNQYVPLADDAASWLPNVNPVHVRQDRTESLSLRLSGYRAMDAANAEASFLTKAQN